MLFVNSLFVLFHLLLLLIYKIYAWDVIEPITYIVGNLYWIATLGYLVFTNRKLDFDLFETKTIKEIYSDKIAKKFGFNKKEKLMIEKLMVISAYALPALILLIICYLITKK